MGRDLALVDLQLAHGSTGFTVAAKLHELGAHLFTSGKAPIFNDRLCSAAGQAIQRGRSGARSRPPRYFGGRDAAPAPAGNLRLFAEEEREAAANHGAAPPPRPLMPDGLKDRAGRVWQLGVGCVYNLRSTPEQSPGAAPRHHHSPRLPEWRPAAHQRASETPAPTVAKRVGCRGDPMSRAAARAPPAWWTMVGALPALERGRPPIGRR